MHSLNTLTSLQIIFNPNIHQSSYSFGAVTLLVERQKGNPACKNLGVGLLVVTIRLELCMSYGSLAPVVTTDSHYPCSNEIQNGNILAPANPNPPGNGC